jgi:hypothetical protein
MPVKITFKGDTKFEIIAGRHTIVTDQPLEDGGGMPG